MKLTEYLDRLPRLRKPKWDYLALSFLLPFCFILALMAVAGYIPFTNEKSMLYSDMWHQYYPFFRDFRENLLNGDGILYNWGIGMGIDYLGLISYYLASPLNLLSILLPESLTLHYFGMLMPIKLGLAGLFFAIFLKGMFKKDDFSLPLFAGFYALCGWALGYQWNIMWLDTFALLPLVALGTVQLLKEKKFVLYTVSLFFSIFANYYIGFFTCIFVLLVFICYQICRCKSLKGFFSDLVRIALFSVLAIGMTAVLELPALAALQTTQSSVNSFPTTFSLNIVKRELYTTAREAWTAFKTAKEAGEGGLIGLWITAMKESFVPILTGMMEVAGNMNGGLEPTFKEGLPNLYCGVGTVSLSFLFLSAKRVKVRDKICAVAMLVFFMLSFLLRQLDYIWHGFHFTNMIPYRFSFLYSFVMLYMAYRAFLLRNTFQPWQLLASAIFCVGIMFCSDKISEPIFLVYNGVFLVLYFGILFFNNFEFPLPKEQDRSVLKRICTERKLRRRYANTAFALAMMLELVINVVNFGVEFPYTGITNYPKGTANSAAVFDYMRQDPELFYRAEVTHAQTLNDGALNGYNGVSTFTSSANVKVTEFMRYLGFGAKNTYNRYCYEESSPVANLFLNLKYLIERDGQVEENPYLLDKYSQGNVHLLENQAYLPLGFLAETELKDFPFQNYGNAFAFQNNLFMAATGLTDNVWTVTPGKSLFVDAGKANVTNKTSAGYTAYENGSASTTMVYRYTVPQSGFMCLDINMSARNSFTIWRNGKQLYSESVSLPQTLSVSQVEPGDTVEIKITCKANENGTITIRAGILNDAIFRQGYEILSKSALDLTEFSSTRVSGNITCNRDGLLYTSIPQNGNWTVKVDGKEVETCTVGDTMVAVPMAQGSHHVEFVYRNSAFTTGLIVSVVCLAVFVGLILLQRYPHKRLQMPKFQK